MEDPKVYQGTIEMLLQNDEFVNEFLQGIRKADLGRLIDEGIFAKLFIADSARTSLFGGFTARSDEDLNAA